MVTPLLQTTTGSINFDLNTVGATLNQSTRLGHNIVGGVADQGSLIGAMAGVGIAVTFIAGALILIIGIPFVIFRFLRRLQSEGRTVGRQ